MRIAALFVCILAVTLLPASLTAGVLVTNGGFESGYDAGTGHCDGFGWDVTGAGWGSVGGFDHWGGTHTGNCALWDGAPGSFSYVSQFIATTIGHSYALEYYLAKTAGIPSEFVAMWGGSEITGSQILNDPADFSWSQMSFTVDATAASTELTFAFRHDPGYFGLDDVALTDLGATGVPEPSLGLVAGLAALAAIRFGRKRSA